MKGVVMIANAKDELKAGTGFMLQLTEGLTFFESEGYTENLIACFDHFECQSGAVKLYPSDFKVDGVMRFENTSDPDDQSILYAISSNDGKIKGAYVESYGLYHDELAPEMIDRFKHLVTLEAFR